MCLAGTVSCFFHTCSCDILFRLVVLLSLPTISSRRFCLLHFFVCGRQFVPCLSRLAASSSCYLLLSSTARLRVAFRMAMPAFHNSYFHTFLPACVHLFIHAYIVSFIHSYLHSCIPTFHSYKFSIPACLPACLPTAFATCCIITIWGACTELCWCVMTRWGIGHTASYRCSRVALFSQRYIHFTKPSWIVSWYSTSLRARQRPRKGMTPYFFHTF